MKIRRIEIFVGEDCASGGSLRFRDLLGAGDGVKGSPEARLVVWRREEVEDG